MVHRKAWYFSAAAMSVGGGERVEEDTRGVARRRRNGRHMPTTPLTRTAARAMALSRRLGLRVFARRHVNACDGVPESIASTCPGDLPATRYIIMHDENVVPR